MNVSKAFLRDFAFLANWYGWTPAEIEEIKEHTRAHPEETKRYWTVLAAAHRAGYKQTEDNGFIRLAAWCEQNGIGNPFAEGFDVTEFEKHKETT